MGCQPEWIPAGIRILVESRVDCTQPANLVLTSTILVVSLSHAAVHIWAVTLQGMALGTAAAIVLSLLLALSRLGTGRPAAS